MSDYLVTGKKGNGKSIYAIAQMLEYLNAGKRVASNIDLYLHKLPPGNKSTYVRLPDCPTIADLVALGRGQTGVVEDDNGVIVLDEVSKFLNSREWQDKGRHEILDWLVHSRKLGWDVIMLAQGVSQIDKQLRSSLLEYHVAVIRTDKWKIPFIGNIGKLIRGKPFYFPRMHIAAIRQGFGPNAFLLDRKFYRGANYYGLYDTQQLFLEPSHPDAVGAHCVLSAWHQVGRLRSEVGGSILVRLKRAFVRLIDPPRKPVVLLPKHPLVLRIMALPCPKQRMEFFRRFEAVGAFSR